MVEATGPKATARSHARDDWGGLLAHAGAKAQFRHGLARARVVRRGRDRFHRPFAGFRRRPLFARRSTAILRRNHDAPDKPL